MHSADRKLMRVEQGDALRHQLTRRFRFAALPWLF